MITEFTISSQKDKKTALKCLLSFAISSIFIILSSITIPSSLYLTYAGKVNRLIPIYRVGRDDKKIAISFDCAWGVEYTDGILKAMEDYGVRCTFFAVKFWVDKYPDYVKKIAENGHEIGTHSATHPHMSKLTKQAVITELTTSISAIENLTGQKVKLFRAPFGEYNDQLIKVADSLNLYTAQWDVDSLDWKDLSSREITERVLKRVKSGSIILCHNNGKHTLESLPAIFSSLTGLGYEFVPISELIYQSDYYVASDGEQRENA